MDLLCSYLFVCSGLECLYLYKLSTFSLLCFVSHKIDWKKILSRIFSLSWNAHNIKSHFTWQNVYFGCLKFFNFSRSSFKMSIDRFFSMENSYKKFVCSLFFTLIDLIDWLNWIEFYSCILNRIKSKKCRPWILAWKLKLETSSFLIHNKVSMDVSFVYVWLLIAVSIIFLFFRSNYRSIPVHRTFP